MRFHIYHHHHATEAVILQKLDAIAKHLNTLEKIMATIQNIVDEVAKERDEIASVKTFIQQMKEQLQGLLQGNLPPDVQAKVDQVFADMQANSTELASAISTTPATAASDKPLSDTTGQPPPG